jgi:hypothetical protein
MRWYINVNKFLNWCAMGGSRGRRTGAPPPLNLEQIWFFGVKSWFFTRNTPKTVENRRPSKMGDVATLLFVHFNFLIPHSGSTNSGNEKQWTSFFSLYRTYLSLYYNTYQHILWIHFGENFIDIWGGADFGPYSSQSFGRRNKTALGPRWQADTSFKIEDP